MYSETLLNHFQAPRNVGEIEDPDAWAEDENPICGDRLQVWLRISNGVIVEMRWKANGCAPAIAAASMASELVAGMPVSEARSFDRERLVRELGGLPPRKAHAAALVASAIGRALANAVE
jgi:nitrogen fixation NifU-like protein